MEQVEELAPTLLSFIVEEMGGVVDISREQLYRHAHGDLKYIKMTLLGDTLRLENVEEKDEN